MQYEFVGQVGNYWWAKDINIFSWEIVIFQVGMGCSSDSSDILFYN